MVETGDYNFGEYNAGVYNLGFDVDAFEFDFTYFYPMNLIFATRVIEKEDGTEQRLRLMASGIRTFEGREDAVTAARKADLEAFSDAKSGSTATFSLTDPVSSGTYTVRFQSSDTLFDHRPDTRWDFSTAFVEVKS